MPMHEPSFRVVSRALQRLCEPIVWVQLVLLAKLDRAYMIKFNVNKGPEIMELRFFPAVG